MGALAASETPLEGWEDAWLGSHRDPYRFAVGVLGLLPHDQPNPDGKPQLEKWQDDFLRPENFFTDPNGKPTDNPRHSVRAGHGVGKGFVIAILALWHPLTHYDAKTVVTANSQDQLRDVAWPEIKKMARRLPEPLYQQLTIGEEKIEVKAQPEMAFVVRRTASRSNPEALQGIHAAHVLYLIDEASGIFETVFEVAQGSLSTKGAIACLFANPTRTGGFFADTHKKLRSTWKCRRVSCEDVPRAQGHIEDIITTYGKESNRYRVRVLGEFPTKDDDTVIPLDIIESAKGRKIVTSELWPVWGLDVARFGDDRTCLIKRQGNTILEAPIVWRNKTTTQIAGLICAEYERTVNDMKPEEICIDVIGYGAGVVDILGERGSPFKGRVSGINVAENAASSTLDHRLRDELWWKGRQWFEDRKCTIPERGCEELITELATPTYTFTSNGKRIVMRKDEMKKELGFSPDIADAFLLSLAGGVYEREPERHRRPHSRHSANSHSDPWGA